jgi:protein-tyrosine phosphatase
MTSVDPTRIDIRFDPREQRMFGTAIHGDTPFNVPFISQIDGNLWQGGCTNGLVLPDSFEHIVSLYPWEEYTINHDMKSKLTVRMYDDANQAMEQVDDIALWVNTCCKDGPTLVHCQAGLNRSGLIAARALMLGGMTALDAIALLRATRSPAVLCNKAFVAHLVSILTVEQELYAKVIARQEEQDAGLDG